MTPDMFRKLSALGLSNEQMAGVLEIFEAEAEKRNEKARARWHKWKSNNPSNVGKRLQTIANNSRAEEDNLQGKVISGEKEKKEASPSARPSRGTRIPDDFQPDIEAAVSEGVPRLEAERQARSFCDYWRSKPGKDGLKLDWPATWRVWYRRNISPPPQQKSAAPPRRQNAFEAYDEIAQLKGWKNEPGIVPSSDEDVQCVSAVGERPSGVVVDLRRGHDWRS